MWDQREGGGGRLCGQQSVRTVYFSYPTNNLFSNLLSSKGLDFIRFSFLNIIRVLEVVPYV